MIYNTFVLQIVAYNKLHPCLGITCVWMSCQPRESSSGFVLAFSAGSEMHVPQMACSHPADCPERAEELNEPRNDLQLTWREVLRLLIN
jgi:hypothetical protein